MLICPRNCLQCNFNYSKVYSSQLVPVQHYFSSLQDLNPKMEKIWEFPDCIHMTKIGFLSRVFHNSFLKLLHSEFNAFLDRI